MNKLATIYMKGCETFIAPLPEIVVRAIVGYWIKTAVVLGVSFAIKEVKRRKALAA